ncbi:MAG: DNA polymerase I, partial [Clostridia bacterium]|nr:DNA polymerase I [Clostridia bacterium]
YYALPPLNNRQGQNVNAVMGFLNIFLKTLENESPDLVVVAFDKRGKNFRKELYAEYKANRKGMPDDLASQLPILQEILTAMKVGFVQKAGIEADDIIGTLVKKIGANSVIFTGDRDLLQLIDDNTTVVLTKRGVTDVVRMDQVALKEQMGLTPSQIVDYKGLCGDSSDNIPGVSGIGDKGALNLLNQFGSVENIYQNLENIKGAVATKLANGKEMAFLSKTLATICTDVDIDVDVNSFGLPVFDANVKAELLKHDFNSIVNRLSFDGLPQEETQQPTIDLVEIVDAQELNKVLSQNADASQFALVVDQDIYFAFDDKKEYCIKLSDNFLEGLTFDQALKILKPILESNIVKILYDSKALRRNLVEFGIAVNKVVYDIDIMQYLAEYRAYKNFGAFKTSKGDGFATLLVAFAKEYEEKLKQLGVWELYTDVELPLSELLLEMELEGIKTDLNALKELSESYVKQIEELTKEVYELAGESFNILSPKQLGYILFEKLGLPHGKKTKTGYSTDNDVLENLMDKHPIISLVLKIRQLAKLNGTYAEGFASLVKNGKIHTHYNQTLTTTGRLSSSEPNLQNIPVREELGREIRKAFVPSKDVLISADYSQVELRWLAYFSDDQNLKQAFIDDEDIHTTVASEIFGIPKQMVASSMRRTAKAVNFGIVYGISDFGLSKNVGIPVSKARQYIVKYFEKYPKIKEYLDGVVEKAKQDGYVTTILGRRRYVPELNSSNFALRGVGERAVKNMPLQGSAS